VLVVLFAGGLTTWLIVEHVAGSSGEQLAPQSA
jgi:hypothetical protein